MEYKKNILIRTLRPQLYQ